MASPSILWYLFHPKFDESRGNRALFDAVADLGNITTVNAYAEYPDFKIDVVAEQDRLRAHDLIVFQHPFYWYSTPPLFKQWMDAVLEYGFAYPPKEGTQLHGKHWLSVITTGGPEWSYQGGGYNNFSMTELLKPLQQTAYLCGMRWHPPFIVHAVLPGDYENIKATDDEALAERASELRRFVESFDPAEWHSLEPVLPPCFLTAAGH
jgi:putative NADPH-quinone reductase